MLTANTDIENSLINGKQDILVPFPQGSVCKVYVKFSDE